MIRIGIAQISLTCQIKQNLARILHFIHQARSNNIDIICFSEYSINPDLNNLMDLSCEIKTIQKACRDCAIWCIFGAYSCRNGQFRNTIYLVNDGGEIQYEYDKVHLWQAENNIFTPGEVTHAINIGPCRIGIICCWDMAFPEFVAQLAREGASIIFCPSYLCDYEQDQHALRSIPQVRAFENCVYFVTCDAATDHTLSESYICHPMRVQGDILQKEGLIFCDVDPEELIMLKNYYNLPESR
ncbi:MAG: carbon-nitrogen hydrolase family protein [Pseudomonadota bacterium]